jgi:hypothetical protein
VLAFAQGFGVVLYAAFWIVVPPDPDQAEPRRRSGCGWWSPCSAAAAIIGVVANTVTGHYFVRIVLAAARRGVESGCSPPRPSANGGCESRTPRWSQPLAGRSG